MSGVSDMDPTRQRRLLAGWGASAVLLIAGILLLLLTSATAVAVVLFVLGVIGSVVVTLGLLRARASVPK